MLVQGNVKMIQQRALASKEREVQTQRLSRFGHACVIALATTLSFLAIGLFAVDKLYHPDTFVIDQLKIKGNFRYLEPSDIEGVIGTKALTNFFSIELVEIKRKVESLPWVRHADIRREWPNTLVVNVEEHIPVMRWKDDMWVTSTGKVIDLPNNIKLTNVVSLFANESDSLLALSTAFRWKNKLREGQLELKKLKLSASQSWTISLYHKASDAQFELLLGREEVEQRLTRFQKLFDQQLSESNIQLLRADARYPDGLAVKSISKSNEGSAGDSLALISLEINSAVNSTTDNEAFNR